MQRNVNKTDGWPGLVYGAKDRQTFDKAKLDP